VTLDEAVALLAQPKTRGRRSATPAAPLRELGDDPATGKPVVVREGRFGPYVTDGETNASLRKGDAVDQITIDRASELLADRRERAPLKKAPAKKAPAKKAPAKRAAARKTPAKKTTARTAAKKAPAKKAPAPSVQPLEEESPVS